MTTPTSPASPTRSRRTVWDRARRAFGDGETAHVLLGAMVSTGAWQVQVGFSPDRPGRVVVRLLSESIDQVAQILVPHGEAVGFHCQADSLAELATAMLEAARGIQELMADA